MSDMTTEPQMGLTFEQVWAALMELRTESRKDHMETERLLKASSADFDRRLQETERLLKASSADFDRRLQETERLLKENSADFDRRMKKSEKDFNRRVGYLDNRFGELAEHLVSPNIVKKFNALGYHFNDVAKERKFYREDGTLAAEFDILLENRESTVGVEVKSKPREQDIEEHIERLAFLRKRKDELGDKRKIRGAIAGAIMPESVRRAALRAGLYVIEQSGDTVQIEEPDEVRGW